MKDINKQRQRLERTEKMVARLQVHAKRVDRLEKRICDRSAFMEKLLRAVHCAEHRFGVVIEHDENEPVERGLVNAMGYLIRELAKERMANNRRPADGRRVNGSAAFFDAYMDARKRHCRAPQVTHASAQTDERDVNFVLEVDGLRKNNAQLCNAVENAEKVNARLNEEIALLREQLEKVKIVKREKAKTRKASNDD
ncbi:hypothetical protein AAVH_10664 [Aphelenchoides avenae]|nr:hypothetical protein AAVH_10664 [Aphelenchus avenae]